MTFIEILQFILLIYVFWLIRNIQKRLNKLDMDPLERMRKAMRK